ncbi:MAG: hypothetical protein GOVbin4691_33 [Prokaryotic dsDNA virus sp.]|nr:MAG: hypothetical protein GOVbin4691_33 [Prokaryotic dsDNA virus sp.]
MSDVIIWKQDNGVVAVTHPAGNCGLTTEEIAQKDVPDGKPYNIRDSSELPDASIFRDAWVVDEETWTISTDMELAREVWRNKIRLARASKWEEVDALWFQAMETPDGDVDSIVNKKQLLRDYPNQESIAEAETIEELQEIWDTELLGDKEWL